MLARLQQVITLGLLATALGWLTYCWQRGEVAWAVAGLLLLLTGHAWILALEFAWMAHINRGDPAPSASAWQVVTAWWGEVRSAPRVFCWLQPFRSRRWPDHLPAAAQGRRGVLLVHGFVCNRGIWNPWMARLRTADVPHVALNLEPVFGSVDDYADAIEEGITQLRRATGLAPLVVAHSMGGLAVRHWWAGRAEPGRVHHVITLGSPHQGAWLARLAFSRNGRQMQRGSRWLAALQQREAALPGSHGAYFTCYYSHCDNIVFPACTATIAGANNRHLAGVAHVHMCTREEPFAEVLRQVAQR